MDERKFTCHKCCKTFMADLADYYYFDGVFESICPNCGNTVYQYLQWHPLYGLTGGDT